MSRPIPFSSTPGSAEEEPLRSGFFSRSTTVVGDEGLYMSPKKVDHKLQTPVYRQKYSPAWWSHVWHKKVQRRTLARIIYIASGFFLMLLWIIIILYFGSKESKLELNNANQDTSRVRGLFDSDDHLVVMLQAQLNKLDADARSLTVEWSMLNVSRDGTTIPLVVGPGSAVGFYRDIGGLFDEAVTNSFNDGFDYFSIDNSSVPRSGVLAEHPWDSVDTDIGLSAAEHSVWRQPQFGYPWDTWTGNITIVTTNIGFENLYNMSAGNGSVFFTYGVSLTGNILNWKIEQSNFDSSFCDPDHGCQLVVTFTARRSPLVIFVVVLVIIVNWLTTIAIFVITGEAILLNRIHVLSGTDILAMCFSALFALPTVRSLLPGAPSEFGAIIDLAGILPNVIIISLCTTTFAISKIRNRIWNSLTEGEKTD